MEAAELLEAGRHLVVLPDTPHALCAVIAFQANEIATAERVLARAIELGVGGPAAQPRHRLLLGWAGLRSGRWAAAQAALDAVADIELPARDALLAAGLELGIARRAGDVERLMRSWPGAAELLVRHPVDLWTLDAIGELVVAGYRLGHRASVEPAEAAVDALLDGLGGAPRLAARRAVATPAVRRGRRRRRASWPRPRPRCTRSRPAPAGWCRCGRPPGCGRRCWAGGSTPTEVQRVAQALQSVGLPWEAARLTGTAAIRAGDESVTRLLLGQARDLRATVPAAEVGEVPSAARAERPRDGGGPADRRGPHLQGDRRPALHLAEDGRAPRGQDPPEGRRHHPGRAPRRAEGVRERSGRVARSGGTSSYESWPTTRPTAERGATP